MTKNNHFQQITDFTSPFKNNITNINYNFLPYKKTYLAFDKIERANKPKHYTQKTKHLSRVAKDLLSITMQKLRNQDKLFLNHKYISKVTKCARRQNTNIIKELSDILNIEYHNSVIHNDKKYRYCYEFSLRKINVSEEKSCATLENDSAQKISQHNIYIENNNKIRSTLSNAFNSFFQIILTTTERGNILNQDKVNQGTSNYKILNQNYATSYHDASGQNKLNQETKTTQDQNLTELLGLNLDESLGFLSKEPRNLPNTISLVNDAIVLRNGGFRVRKGVDLVDGDETLDSPKNSSLSIGNFFHPSKPLSEMLEYLTDNVCNKIRLSCKRNFTNRAIREIAKAVSKTKKGTKVFFYHFNGFVAYLSKVLKFEKRNPEKISSENYYIISNQTDEEIEVSLQEKYHANIEYSLETSPEFVLRKKLAASLERSKAYNLLKSFSSLEITKDEKAIMTLDKPVSLSKLDQEIILNQIKSIYERMSNDGTTLFITSFETTIWNKKTNKGISDKSTGVIRSEFEENKKVENLQNPQVKNDYPAKDKENTEVNTKIDDEVSKIFLKIRQTFLNYFGNDKGKAILDTWISKLYGEVDKNTKTINLFAQTSFIKSWVNQNYHNLISRSVKESGYELGEIFVG